MQDKPLILITNDDGITAPGLRALIGIMNKIGEVVVVAPDSPQSGMGHAITVDNVLTCNPITIDEGTNKLIGTDYSEIPIHVNRINYDEQFTGIDLWDGNSAERIIKILKEKLNV